MTGAEAAGIALDGRRATGVRFRRDGAERTIWARREVLLAAGANGSPQILQLSGIGPGPGLKSARGEGRHVLPGGGENLQGHFQARFVYGCSPPGRLQYGLQHRSEQV